MSDKVEFSKSFTASHYKKILDFIKINFSNSLSLESLAKEVGISTHHFSRVFKATVGKSPMQFVMAYRVEQAKKLLFNKELNLVDIAQQCGFSDQAHFSRVFKARYGKPTKSFR